MHFLLSAFCFLLSRRAAAGKKAGSRLYTHADLDHPQLFQLAGSLAGDFMMTYDNTEEIRAFARMHGFDTHPIAMKNTHHAAMTELIIGRCLDWLR
jgi:DNA adenine methylase